MVRDLWGRGYADMAEMREHLAWIGTGTFASLEDEERLWAERRRLWELERPERERREAASEERRRQERRAREADRARVASGEVVPLLRCPDHVAGCTACMCCGPAGRSSSGDGRRCRGSGWVADETAIAIARGTFGI